MIYSKEILVLGQPRWGGGGGVHFLIKRLMGMCRLMGSHFNDWIDYNGVAFQKSY